MRDYKFHCEDCDSYSQCQYYHNRKGTSLICKEFQYGSSVIEQIRDEIERLHYHPKLDFIKNDEVVEMALNVIDKYMKGE